MKALIKSFGYAFAGIITCIKNERNMRIHLCVTVYMFCYLLVFDFFEVSRLQFAVLCVMCALVMGGELINTAIERTVDLASTQRTENGKIAKDCAAGAVLVCAIFAVICGVLILFQPEAFRKMAQYYAGHIYMLLILAISLVLAVMFIFNGPTLIKRKNNNGK